MILILQNYVWYFEHNQSFLGLLLDSTREQTIQTQLQLNSTVTTRESAAVLPSEEKYSAHGTEKPIAISDGCPAPRAQVIIISIPSKLDKNASQLVKNVDTRLSNHRYNSIIGTASN